MEIKDLREVINSVSPIRMSDFVRFLRSTGRHERCPFCDYVGNWNFHIQLPADGADVDHDPLVCVYALSQVHDLNVQECTAITCPKCAHLSMFDLAQVKLHKHGYEHASREVENWEKL